MIDPNQTSDPWQDALELAEYDHHCIWRFKVHEAAEKGWRDEMRLVSFEFAEPKRPGEPPSWYVPANVLFRGGGAVEAQEDALKRLKLQRAIRDVIHVTWPMGLIPAFDDHLQADVLGKRFILRDTGLFLWTEMGDGYEFGPLTHAAEVGEALLVLDGRLTNKPERGRVSAPPPSVVAGLRNLPPADDWWWNWEERCLRSYLLYRISPGAWAADELRDHLRRVLRTEPENEAIEIRSDTDGQPLARYEVPTVGNVVFQAKALRYEHRCDRCGTVYSPEITNFEDLGWTLELWEFELHQG